jgi:DUF4097 and DUF4098 domain-containing protein YvlB
LNPDGIVRVFNYAGSVRIVGWDKDSVVLTGTIPAGMTLFGGGSPSGVKFNVSDDKGANTLPADLVLRVPARARLTVNGTNTDVDCSAVAGALDVNTTAGSVKVRGTPREVKVETINGAIEIGASPAYLRAKSATGAITWVGSSDDVAFTTVTGRINASGGTVTRARFESIDGNVVVAQGMSESAAVVVDTHSGSIGVELPRGANIATETTVGTAKTKYQTFGKPGAGDPRIVARSFKGRVTITQP